MKVYISAPISGYDLEGRKEFFQAVEEFVRACGHQPVNPMGGIDTDNPPVKEECMKADITDLLTCDAMLQVGDWQNSKGCMTELNVAEACGIKVFRIKEAEHE